MPAWASKLLVLISACARRSLCRQRVLLRFCAGPRALACSEVEFRHPQLYHHKSGTALSSANGFCGGDFGGTRRENRQLQAWPIMLCI